jgi:hypothetical protein
MLFPISELYPAIFEEQDDPSVLLSYFENLADIHVLEVFD